MKLHAPALSGMPLARILAAVGIISVSWVLLGCNGINADVPLANGAATGEASAGIDQATAQYVILDLAGGGLTTAMVLPDLTTNASYRTSRMVFRRVTGLGSDYLLGVFEVTQGQWQTIAPAATQPWTLVDTAVVGNSAVAPSSPAFNVSNDDIVASLALYNAGKIAHLALPSDEQWQYACAAGGSGSWSWGDGSDRASIQPYAVVAETRSAPGAVEVGTLAANAWGFYDMHGNVWEWTGSGSQAHIRGGSWHDAVALARISVVGDPGSGVYSSTHHALIGMRLVLRQ